MGGKQQESQEMGKGVHEQIEFAVLVQKLRVAGTVTCKLQKTLHVHVHHTWVLYMPGTGTCVHEEKKKRSFL